jgi:cleavage and polyadenylation specificity factor subunit 2
MATILRMTPISGVHSEDPLCYLLEIDDCKILLDCGWDERFETDFLEALAKVASSVDFVLLSHPDLPHLGALPYAVRRLGLDCPIISTRPVWQMGHLFMFDVYQSRKSNEDFDVFSLDDIDSAFSEERFSHLKYSQRYDLPGKGAGISVTPYVAGHMLGGTIWKIQKDTEEIVYAVDCNKQRERLLNGTVLESVSQRPAVLITDAFNAQYTQKLKIGARAREMTESALSTLRNGGNVLMPIDTAGRVFEIMLVLESKWHAEKLREQYPLVLLHYEAKNVVHYGKVATEWMRDGCKFSFESFHLHERLSTFDELTQSGQPTLVLSSFASLETGFARELFLRWAPDPRNLVLFTERPHPDTLGRLLVDFYLQRQPPPRTMPLTVHRRVPLQGAELEAFQEEHREVREQKLAELRAAREEREREEAERAKEMESELDIDSDGEEDQEKMAQLVVAKRMFPATEVVRTYDDYGETINPRDYMDAETLQLEREQKNKADVAELEKGMKESELLEQKQPTKCSVETVDVRINCRVRYIDFEGRYDGNDLMNVLRYMRPHKMLIVHADRASSTYLKAMCERSVAGQQPLLQVGNVFAPTCRPVQQTIDVTSDNLVRKALVQDGLYDQIDFFYSDVDKYHLAHIDAVVSTGKKKAEGGKKAKKSKKRKKGDEDGEADEGDDGGGRRGRRRRRRGRRR